MYMSFSLVTAWTASDSTGVYTGPETDPSLSEEVSCPRSL